MKSIVKVSLALAVVSTAALAANQEAAMDARFTVTSPSFADGAPIPPRFTADGADISPELVLANPPDGTISFALIMDDPDAPVGTWVHWVAWDIPADTRTIPEGSLPDAAVEGRNSWGRTGYGGPAPPSGTHRYFFKVYALDAALDLPSTTDKAGLERATADHVLAEAVLMGTYSRGR
jgi:Raf kinase inhibitor-like YbhB/YbcL family protein